MKTKLTKSQRDRLAALRKRQYNGMPVRDALADLHVQPSREDINNAVKGDPESCAYACCIRRTMHSQLVFIYKTRAYIQTLDEDGQPIIERFIINGATAQLITDFDSGKQIIAAGFIFKAPRGSKTLDYRREHAQKASIRATDAKYWEMRKKMRINGTVAKPKRRPPANTMEAYRDGSGYVKFRAQTFQFKKHDGRTTTEET